MNLLSISDLHSLCHIMNNNFRTVSYHIELLSRNASKIYEYIWFDTLESLSASIF